MKNIKYKVDIESHGNLMPLDIFKIFYKQTMQQLAKDKNKRVIFCDTQQIKIMHLVVCSVTMKHKNKDKLCRSFVNPGGSHRTIGGVRDWETWHPICEVQHNET